LRERALGLAEPPDQEQAPDLEVARVRGVREVTVGVQRRPSGVERSRGPTEVARGERDLDLGHDATGAGHALVRAEPPPRAPQQLTPLVPVAAVTHADAP